MHGMHDVEGAIPSGSTISVFEIFVEGVVSGQRIDDLFVNDVSKRLCFTLGLGRTSWAPETSF